MSDTTDFRLCEPEKRMNNVEDLIVDLPHTMNLRLETIVGAQHEAAARLGLMDKRIGRLEKRMGGLEQRQEGVEQRLEGVDHRLEGVQQRLVSIDDKLQKLLNRS